MTVDDTKPRHSARIAMAAHVTAAALASVLFLIASVRFGGSVAGDELDPSWTMVLRWASMHGLRWGSDIVFTYGPLGYLSPYNACDPGFYGAFVAAQIALAGAAAFLFANAWFAQRWPERIVLATAVVFAAPMLAADPVWLSMPAVALVGMYAHAAAGRRRALWLLLAVAAPYLSTILLIKMSTLLLVVTCWLAGIVVLLRARLRRHAVAWLVLVPVCSLALWIASGQRPGDLPAFVSVVFEISRGYTAAMGSFPPPFYDGYGLTVVGGSGLVGLWAAWRARLDVARLACIALCGLTVFVAWRAGFTRADTHVVIFVLTAWLVLPLLPSLTPAATPWLRAAALALAIAAAPIADRAFNPGTGHRRGELPVASLRTLRSNVDLLARPLTYRPLLVATLDRERLRLDLPQTRAAVGRRSVDLVGTQQGVVMFNGLAYRPAPVFQGYGAYTPRLQRLNADAYSGPDRTDFVLLAYSPIDGNLPTGENALAFTTLYRNYHPVLVEKSYLLLEKDAESVPPQSPSEDGWRDATWGEWIDLPTTPETVTVLALRSALSVPGKVVATLLREPGQQIELELADGSTRRFRLVRGATPGGFLVSPLVQSLDDYVRLFVGADLPVVRRFRLLPQSEAMRTLFADGVQWNATQLPRRPRSELTPAMRDAFYPGFSHRPQSVTDGAHTIDVQGRRVLFMHSPWQLTFAPGAGTYVVTGEIGIVPNAFASDGCGGGDGVDVKVSNGAGAMLTYRYDPFADAALRPARRFELGPVDVGPDGVLRLDVTPGPANNADCDWAWLRDVTIRAAERAD
ncbi:hypothetical protein [Tahibacter soli]|uniref:Uncharacterized protein n=1 Tax=Tahibacter soli TaxID=2983605 RepID=A0A9X3YTW5_9GAMM|nr:hypothetical protein [Tahibacter soli]MDC8016216.1 hypothetical protein [Tahibacter soli]